LQYRTEDFTMNKTIALAITAATILSSGAACFAADEQVGQGAPAPIVGQPSADTNKTTPAPVEHKVRHEQPAQNGGAQQPQEPTK
jgi:hypothetical protein